MGHPPPHRQRRPSPDGDLPQARDRQARLAHSDREPGEDVRRVREGDALLEPTRIYVRPVSKVLEEVDVHGVAHITGGGFYENMPRCLKPGLGIKINKGSWEIPEIFPFLQKLGNVDEKDMYNVFNMGIGMILVVAEKDVERTMEILAANGEKPSVIGTVTDGEGIVIE
ncbi:MAG: AIR synthase-related protein [Bullifex sp.]|nr:AIR synthase-related protein [Bullifex sp.]